MTNKEVLGLIEDTKKTCDGWFLKLEEADNQQTLLDDGKYKFKAGEYRAYLAFINKSECVANYFPANSEQAKRLWNATNNARGDLKTRDIASIETGTTEIFNALQTCEEHLKSGYGEHLAGPLVSGQADQADADFQFLTGQILYNNIDLNISAGNKYDILMKLVGNVNHVVTKTELDGISPRFPHCVHELRGILKISKLPYEIKTVPGDGYKLSRKSVSTTKKRPA